MSQRIIGSEAGPRLNSQMIAAINKADKKPHKIMKNRTCFWWKESLRLWRLRGLWLEVVVPGSSMISIGVD
jgi:hypothetical protein